MEAVKKWSTIAIIAREKYLCEIFSGTSSKVFNSLRWPEFDVGDQVINIKTNSRGIVNNVYCTDAGVQVINPHGRDLSMEPWWWHIVEWEGGQVDHTVLGSDLKACS